MFDKNFIWCNLSELFSKGYVCSYCNHKVASNTGYFYGDNTRKIYICPNCENPTYFCLDSELQVDLQIPSPPFGEDVKNLPDKIENLYNEARRCMAVSAYTSSVMLCRILLMHIAVEKGADKNKSFKDYVDWLEKSGFIPPDSKPLLEYIREKGNDANHEIQLMNHQDAENLITFIGILMKFVYEFSSIIPQQGNPGNSL